MESEKDIKVSFVIYDITDDDSYLKSLMQISGSSFMQAGEKSRIERQGKTSDMVVRRSRWELKSTLPVESEVELQIDQLLHLLVPHSKLIKKFSKKYHTILLCTCLSYESRFGLQLTSRQIKQIEMLGAILALDLYLLKP